MVRIEVVGPESFGFGPPPRRIDTNCVQSTAVCQLNPLRIGQQDPHRVLSRARKIDALRARS